MTNFEELQENLEKFGLSKNQAAIYLYLVQHRELRIQELVNLAQIPRSSVYECLKGLFERGLVEEIVDDSFKKIKPYPIDAIRHTINEKIHHFQKLTSDLEKLKETLTILPNTQSTLTTIVRYYKDTAGARQLFWNTLNAKGIVYVYSEYGRSKFVGRPFYMDFVRESYAREIKEKVLINPTTRAIDFIKRDTGTSMARTRIEDIRTLPEESLLIKGETFIYDTIYSHIYLDEEGITGFEIESANFTTTQRSIFETLWQTAKPVSVIID